MTKAITTGTAVTTTKGAGTALETTWIGTIVIVREDATALVKWHSPMPARSLDFPIEELTAA